MATGTQLFSEFPTVTKADWLAQIAKDLKGRDPETLIWHLSEELPVSPLVHADDFETPLPPLDTRAGWEICEKIDASDPAAGNAQILEALSFGVQGLNIHFEKIPDAAELDRLLSNVHLNMIGLYLGGLGITANPGALLALLNHVASARGVDAKELRGGLLYNPGAASGIQDWRYLFDLIAYARVEFPKFTVVGIDGRNLHQGVSGTIEEIAGLLRRGHICMEKLIERGLEPWAAASQIVFTISIGTSYFAEIAKIRAFKLLWLHVLQAWDAPLNYPVIDAQLAEFGYSDDLFTNMISATTMAMSAVIGGVQRLYLPPYDNNREEQSPYPPAFGHRIARNVQHLLQLESEFDTLEDPAAGSYYIEKLTLSLAEKAWARFQA